jgi:L-threonylcarbamoyladenylate synthase
METRVLPYSQENIAEAARAVLAGDVVAVPTETVYGLAADATNAFAVARIYEAKGRPSFNPLIVHVRTLGDALELGEFSAEALELARAFSSDEAVPFENGILDAIKRRLERT